jgi:hypothetical protein
VGKLLEEAGFDGKRTQYRYGRHDGRLEGVKEGDRETRFEFDGAGRLECRIPIRRCASGRFSTFPA